MVSTQTWLHRQQRLRKARMLHRKLARSRERDGGTKVEKEEGTKKDEVLIYICAVLSAK